MTKYVDYYINEDTYKIILLLYDCDAEDCMDVPSTLNMRESYGIKYQTQYPDTTMCMELLLGEHADEYCKLLYHDIHIIIRRDTCEVVTGKQFADYNVLPGAWDFK